MTRLRRYIAVWAMGCATVVLLPLVVGASLMTMHNAQVQADARLALAAGALESMVRELDGTAAQVAGSGKIDAAPHVTSAQDPGTTATGSLGYQYWNTPAALRIGTPNLHGWTFDVAPIGFATIHRADGTWRVYTKIGGNGGFVRAAEPVAIQRTLRFALLAQNAAVLLLVIPLLGFVIFRCVGCGLAPLASIADRLRVHPVDATGPLDVHEAPQEAAPLLFALNGWLQRSRGALDRERRFTTQVIAGFRVPLAALLAKLQGAAASDDAGERRAALADACARIDGMAAAVGQIADLSRCDAGSLSRCGKPVDVEHCIAGELRQLEAGAAALDVAIVKIHADALPLVHAWESGVRLAIRKLVEHAIRFTPPGGTVTVATVTTPGAVTISVTSDPSCIGPLQSVRLSRSAHEACSSEGLGLGLALVRRIADLHGTTLRISEPSDRRRGLRITIEFMTDNPGAAAARGDT